VSQLKGLPFSSVIAIRRWSVTLPGCLGWPRIVREDMRDMKSICESVRLLVVTAAVIGQLVSASAACACEKPCCSAPTETSCCASILSGEPDACSPCPLCGPQRCEEVPSPPCHCQLQTRHDSAATAEGRTVRDLRQSDAVCHVLAVEDSSPSSGELNRVVLAASQTIPYRPPRIVFGVWRN
jgi:hypothetical protein